MKNSNVILFPAPKTSFLNDWEAANIKLNEEIDKLSAYLDYLRHEEFENLQYLLTSEMMQSIYGINQIIAKVHRLWLDCSNSVVLAH